jgi:hypothetical protein
MVKSVSLSVPLTGETVAVPSVGPSLTVNIASADTLTPLMAAVSVKVYVIPAYSPFSAIMR